MVRKCYIILITNDILSGRQFLRCHSIHSICTLCYRILMEKFSLLINTFLFMSYSLLPMDQILCPFSLVQSFSKDFHGRLTTQSSFSDILPHSDTTPYHPPLSPVLQSSSFLLPLFTCLRYFCSRYFRCWSKNNDLVFLTLSVTFSLPTSIPAPIHFLVSETGRICYLQVTS